MSWPPCHRNRRGGTHEQTITELDKWNVIDLAYYTMQAHPFAAPRPPFPRHSTLTPPIISNMFGEPTNISHSGRQSALRTYDRVKGCDVKHVKHVPRCLDRRHRHQASSLIKRGDGGESRCHVCQDMFIQSGEARDCGDLDTITTIVLKNNNNTTD